VPRGMIAAPPFMPPWGMAFPGGMPQMPPMPGGMPKFPSPPPTQPAFPQNGQPQQPEQPAAAPQAYQPQMYQPPAYQPPVYQPQGYQPPGYPPQGYMPPGFQPPAYQPLAHPSPLAAAAAFDPIAGQQLAALQQAVQTAQPAPVQTEQAAQSGDHPIGETVAPKVQQPVPSVSRVRRPDTYSTKSRNAQYSTNG
jgi:hypothetical protein